MVVDKKFRFLISTAALCGALSISCGDESEDGDSGDTGDNNAQGEEMVTKTLTLVPITALDDSAPIADVHHVSFLDSTTGLAFNPAVEGDTTAGTGKITITAPKRISDVYIVGVARTPVETSTYDTVILNTDPAAGETLLRISSQGTASLAGSVAGYAARDDRASFSGAIYWAPDGAIKGAVGCAKVYLDDNTGNAEDEDQRYVGPNRLPTTYAKLDHTLRGGSFFFGNMTKGKHKVRVSVDNGKTFIPEAEVSFNVTVARQDAKSPFKSVLYQLPIYVKTPTNPMPADCPQDPASL